MPVPSVGDLAPDVTLPATDGSSVTLSSFRGKQNVLLAFFPAAFSGVCTEEMCAFDEDLSQFASRDVAVIPVSVDSIFALKEFKAKHQMSLDLLSDSRHAAATAYGVLMPERLVARRSYFLVDKQGVVRWARVEEQNIERRQNDELLAAIAALG